MYNNIVDFIEDPKEATVVVDTEGKSNEEIFGGDECSTIYDINDEMNNNIEENIGAVEIKGPQPKKNKTSNKYTYI